MLFLLLISNLKHIELFISLFTFTDQIHGFQVCLIDHLPFAMLFFTFGSSLLAVLRRQLLLSRRHWNIKIVSVVSAINSFVTSEDTWSIDSMRAAKSSRWKTDFYVSTIKREIGLKFPPMLIYPVTTERACWGSLVSETIQLKKLWEKKKCRCVWVYVHVMPSAEQALLVSACKHEWTKSRHKVHGGVRTAS